MEETNWRRRLRCTAWRRRNPQPEAAPVPRHAVPRHLTGALDAAEAVRAQASLPAASRRGREAWPREDAATVGGAGMRQAPTLLIAAVFREVGVKGKQWRRR